LRYITNQKEGEPSKRRNAEVYEPVGQGWKGLGSVIQETTQKKTPKKKNPKKKENRSRKKLKGEGTKEGAAAGRVRGKKNQEGKFKRREEGYPACLRASEHAA